MSKALLHTLCCLVLKYSKGFIVSVKIQQENTTELLTSTSENSCKGRNKDVIQTENNTQQKEIPARAGRPKANKYLL